MGVPPRALGVSLSATRPPARMANTLRAFRYYRSRKTRGIGFPYTLYIYTSITLYPYFHVHQVEYMAGSDTRCFSSEPAGAQAYFFKSIFGGCFYFFRREIALGSD